MGITPAYAGNTPTGTRLKSLREDHPRLRGEHSFMLFSCSSRPGSPPPTRGTRNRVITLPGFLGITPAYAGNTRTYSYFYIFSRDHPRLRGEHYDLDQNTGVYPGSPPPTRGTQEWNISQFVGYRITPAYAGNTESLPL